MDRTSFKHQPVKRSRLAVAALYALLAGCGGGNTESSSSTPAPAPAPGSITLEWDEPTVNVDGTPLINLASYRVYVKSNAAGQYPNTAALEISPSPPGSTEQATLNLANGTHYIVVTARDTSGNESVYSNEISVTLP